MARIRLYWKLLAIFLALLTAAVLIAAGFATGALEHDLLAAHADGLAAQARLIAGPAEPLLHSASTGDTAGQSALQARCLEWSRAAGAALQIFDARGRLCADSASPDTPLPPTGPGEGFDRLPEFAAARSTGVGTDLRYVFKDPAAVQYVALRLGPADAPLGYLRFHRPVGFVADRVDALWRRCLLLWLILVILTVAVSLWLRRRLEAPLQKIRAGAERFAEGRFVPAIDLDDTADASGLAATLNRMAAQLSDRIDTIVLQRNEQEAILASMIEGVVAVDNGEKVLTVNNVAARLFGGTVEGLRGKLFQEISRIPALQEFVGRTLSAETPQEGEFTRYEGGELRSLQAHGAALRDAAGKRLGAVIVLHDNTHLRRLERLQREFVANVSHELKTPVTSIKGFIETLQEGALKDPAEAHRFLEIIARHADRLGAIIEDLLLLSRLDQDTDSATLERTPADLRALLDEAVDHCAARAAAKDIQLAVSGQSALPVAVNHRLVVQVLVNLIDNAVKYSDPGREVAVTLADAGAEVAIAVRDHGCGIASEHLQRLGERFYRVDTARSRKQGGTGLGVAIARQIVRAHGGRLAVESTVGEGSTFTLFLPAGREA